MNYYKAAEQVLMSVPMLEQALKNIQSRKRRLIEQGKPHGVETVRFDKPFAGVSYVNDTLNELLAIAECERNEEETIEKLREIRGVLEQLDKEARKLLAAWYIERKPKEIILQDLHVESMTTVYNMRNKAVASFALLYFGASALHSI